MPLYDFECAKCGTVFEYSVKIVDFDAGKRPSCCSCGSKKTRKLMSAVAFSSGGKSVSAHSHGQGGCGCSGGSGCGTSCKC